MYGAHAFLITSFLAGILFGVILFSSESQEQIRELKKFQPTLPTRLYDIKGRLISELFLHKRELVRLEEIPKPVRTTFITVEDVRFYEHFGIDFVGIARAVWENIKALDLVQGGSTLTQQLVKGLYTRGERTFARKFYEAVLALQVEKEFSKDEILEMYLNQIYLGHGAYGLSSASRFYFDKEIKKLNLVEASILAGLPKAPHAYSPFKNPHQAFKKSKVVLQEMAGYGHFSKEEALELHHKYWEEYRKTILVTPETKTSYGGKKDLAPYFTEYVRQFLEKKIGKEALYSSGLQVYTTLDLDLQIAGEEVLKKALERADPMARSSNELLGDGVDEEFLSTYSILRSVLPLPGIVKKYSPRNEFRKAFKRSLSPAMEMLSLSLPTPKVNDHSLKFLSSTKEFRTDLNVQGALMAMEPHTGRILGMIGGREFKASDQFNRAISAKRQPGSAFKPFVYGAALEDRAIHSNTGFIDSPILNIAPDGSTWAPSNYEGSYRGQVTSTRALSLSMNLVSIQIYDLIGPEKVIGFASKMMKIPPDRFQDNPSLALGSSEVTPFELLQGYNVVANYGKDVVPYSVVYVTNRDGNVLYNFENEVFDALETKKREGSLRVLEPGIAYILHKMMQSVLNGTAHSGVRVAGGFLGDAAGKTGTTSSWNDAWFAGFTSDISAVVWMGLDQGSQTLGKHQSGGSVAAPVWGKFIQRVYEKRGGQPKKFNWATPEGVSTISVTKNSGQLPNPECEEELIISYVPSRIEVDGEVKQVPLTSSDCGTVETKNFLDLIQEKHEITDEEIGKESKFQRQYQAGE